ncbi:2112_t:CDS:2 [Ambispora gerdemannii]|uniref:2112_t:CDS:1 n=1 Tax=Ambispora gerdemannii TaxID=144530 RepID=A0A9N9H0U5_9GLOM|nr:2112_t:CDS:2 [Ambispora gerdemannii]
MVTVKAGDNLTCQKGNPLKSTIASSSSIILDDPMHNFVMDILFKIAEEFRLLCERHKSFTTALCSPSDKKYTLFTGREEDPRVFTGGGEGSWVFAMLLIVAWVSMANE